MNKELNPYRDEPGFAPAEIEKRKYYHDPESPTLFDHVLVNLNIEETSVWIPYVVHESHVTFDAEFPEDILDILSNKKVQKAITSINYSIMKVIAPPNIPFEEWLKEALLYHQQKLRIQDEMSRH